MYDQFYGFTERPFSLLPDPDFLFLGEKHRAALDTLELAIFNHSGFCVISGEIGAGKTTLVRELLNRLKDDIQVGLVSNTHPSFGELMQWIMAAYGLPGGTEDRLVLHKRFIDFVIQRYADGKHTLLIIDEAQNLSLAALEELRMLSNVNSEKDLVLQIILIGQSELRDNLRKPELAQFAQRISIDYFLGGLTPDETALYIQHRVVHAGGSADLFSVDACRKVFEYSQGIPRVINRLCDLSLVYGFAENLEQITADAVLLVAKEQHMGEAMEAARKRAADPAPAKKPLVTKTQATDAKPVASADVAPVVPPEPEPEPAPETLAETSDLHPELQAKPASKPKTNTRKDDLHTLVVNAEKTAGSRGERSALWLFVGVAVMVGAAGWVSRDAWLPTQQIASQGEQVTVEPSDKEAQEVQREETARLAEQEAAEKAKLEQAALDKADQEKAASLAKQEAAEKAKLEQAKREKASKKKAVRLAKQKAAKKAKREKARREKAARVAKQQAAEKAEREEAALLAQQKEQERREHAARALLGGPDWSDEDDEASVNPPVVQSEIPAPQVKSFKKVGEKEQARRERAARAMLGSTADWSEEDDEQVESTTVALPESTATVVESDEDASGVVSDADGFSSNPCDGPTARFLSTCR
ncbi:General secretion pathway protein A [hydrothermal vent metagenome]|uniref:General secretion pathway protein A n=2 Tax=hydrothermal vent metagenome TaxID=652676 RepID=A0A3B0Y9D6_9ZZZZ